MGSRWLLGDGIRAIVVRGKHALDREAVARKRLWCPAAGKWRIAAPRAGWASVGPKESVPHITNFIDCVRTCEKPAADAEVGHRATTVCHLINLCRKLGRTRRWDPKNEKFLGDDANKFIAPPRRRGYELPVT